MQKSDFIAFSQLAPVVRSRPDPVKGSLSELFCQSSALNSRFGRFPDMSPVAWLASSVNLAWLSTEMLGEEIRRSVPPEDDGDSS
ncbi:unnamed protein product [Protopolystoma xenopodis]|uniref:Uncharacterized protein n=1 Tax=Protopolystoma xenopodis TaxID=117903 RepID=A0A448WXQ1_9PLAT|nr:unnamed protein product [Protopolystoma xenopodis]